MLPEKIECPVYFMLYRNKEGKMALSMADQGFEKPATLKHNRRGSWLILKRKEMQGFSRINREKMSGHLDTLKYDQEGTLIQAECRDDMIRIPLRAFQFHRRQGGEVRGALSVTMTALEGAICRRAQPFSYSGCRCGSVKHGAIRVIRVIYTMAKQYKGN